MNYIEPMVTGDPKSPGDLIKIHVGVNSPTTFLKTECINKFWGMSPNYMAPIDIDILNCAWYCAIGKSVVIVGKLEKPVIIKFIELLLKYGAFTVCGIDSDDELHIVNCELFSRNKRK